MENQKPESNGASEPVGQHLAAQMLENLVILNEQLKVGQQLQERILERLDNLDAAHEVYGLMMEILHEKRGKKLGIADVADAYVEAADEIMPEGDEPGEEDPLVEVRR